MASEEIKKATGAPVYVSREDSGKLSSFVYKVDSEKARELFGKLLFCWTKELKHKKTKCREVLYSIYSLLFESESNEETVSIIIAGFCIFS